MAKWTWLAFLLSMFSFVLGFVLVFVFICIIIVPSVPRRQYELDQYCKILDIYKVEFEQEQRYGKQLNVSQLIDRGYRNKTNIERGTSGMSYSIVSCYMVSNYRI